MPPLFGGLNGKKIGIGKKMYGREKSKRYSGYKNK